MLTLGINAAFHDSSACLVKDGKLIAAAEEERFTRIKHAKRPIPFTAYELPFNAIHFCLTYADLYLDDIDHIAYSFNPESFVNKTETSINLPLSLDTNLTEGNSLWEPLFYAYILNATGQLRDGAPHHLENRLWKNKKEKFFSWHYVDHHLAHAASAFLVAPYKSAAILTLDGRGENATTTYAMGVDDEISIIDQVYMPHSLGLLYEKITDYLGFLHSSDEYKVMALASYGQPKYIDEFRSMVSIKDGGQYQIKQIDFEKKFGSKRQKGDAFEQQHFDIAHSLQAVLEESVLKLVDWLYQRTGEKNLCMAGGVALNCVMNGRIRDKGPFKNIWIQPAAGDAGTALGAAFLIDAQNNSNNKDRPFVMQHSYWGPEFSDDEIEDFLCYTKTPFKKMANVSQETANLLTEGKIVGWFQGRMEFGPRALGARSILASPIDISMQQKINDIKGREDFRPVAPVILEEDVPEWFVQNHQSPFMLFVFDVNEDKKEKIPSVCHVDLTARVQTVKREHNPLYYDTIAAFKELTGVPILINTSFNTKERPIVCSISDALECFWTSPLDVLIIGSYLVTKEDQR